MAFRVGFVHVAATSFVRRVMVMVTARAGRLGQIQARFVVFCTLTEGSYGLHFKVTLAHENGRLVEAIERQPKTAVPAHERDRLL